MQLKATPSDYAMQRAKTGKVQYEEGQTLDRKKRAYTSKNNESDATRFDGPVRKASRSGPVDNSAFDLHRDEPYAARAVSARMELDEIVACVGPLWPPLTDAIQAFCCRNSGGYFH